MIAEVLQGFDDPRVVLFADDGDVFKFFAHGLIVANP
jgi:hypothetical protein